MTMNATIILIFGGLACLAGGYGAFQTRRHINYYPVQRLLFAGISAWGGQIALRAYNPALLDSYTLRAALAVFMGGVCLWGAGLVRKRNRTPASEDVTLGGRVLPLDRRTAERQVDTAVELVESGRVAPYAWLERRRAAHKQAGMRTARQERWR